MTGTALRLARGAALLAALLVAASSAARGDDPPPSDDERLLANPEKAEDPESLRRAAEDALAKDPEQPRAMRGLLVAVTRLGDRDLLDDAIPRAQVRADPGDVELRAAYGSALLTRARLDDPPERERLVAAGEALSFALSSGPTRACLDLAYVRHLLADVPGARAAYLRAIELATNSADDEEVVDRATPGLKNLLGRSAPAAVDALRGATGYGDQQQCQFARAAATLLFEAGQGDEALRLLGHRAAVLRSPRTLALRARLSRAATRHAEALADERRAVSLAGTVKGGGGTVLDAVETLWREKRPISSFEDCRAYERDYDDLVSRARGYPRVQAAWLNNVALRFREVVSTFTWRGEGRTQGIAEGAPSEARDLLARCVALYDGAVSLIPEDAATKTFDERWAYAGILNDAGLMRHYFVDVRNLARAEALYLRAFELTGGAYMDTYFYNLQYLYGFAEPGHEEAWMRLAERARTRILKEGAGGYEADARKRESAARDAEALKRLVESRPR